MNDLQLVNILKGLVIDSVNKANSGHPGGPMSSMDMTYILFSEYLNFNPDDPNWMGRDRFVLSAGHMSTLLYSMLNGIGWIGIEDLKEFRQLHSKTPGHPENFQTPGVECTTGPLGQGAAMSVGMALAASHFAERMDKDLFNYNTWAIVSDGDLQEGVAMGAASLAGHLKLGNLIWVYDKNYIQLSGPTDEVVSDDDRKVYEGFGWHVINVEGHDHEALRKAYDEALTIKDKPTLVIAKTTIGHGCVTMANSSKTHGSPLPAQERTDTKKAMGLPDQDFYWPAEAASHFQRNFDNLREKAVAWNTAFETKLGQDKQFADLYKRCFKDTNHDVPAINWNREKPMATRNAFGEIITAWAESLPGMIGGSADLEPSNMTEGFSNATGDFSYKKRDGRNLNFGVREFPMSAICNGMALHGGVIPFDATFLSFADYSRPALRLGSIQKVRVIHEFTHDSFYLGEDGPTHQPIEQVMALRTIPDFYVMRPADPQETEVLMKKAIHLSLPSALCLTRQKVPYLDLPESTVELAAKGAYCVQDVTDPDMVILATGSEVGLALEVAKGLDGRKVRVVSMPCWELFEEQPQDYKDQVLAPQCAQRVSIEAGVTLGWHKYLGTNGLAIGVDHYGASAPAEVLAKEYGFTAEQIVKRIKDTFK